MLRFFEQQPDEILVEIMSHLSFLDRVKIRQVDKRFLRLSRHRLLTLSEIEKEKLSEAIYDAIAYENEKVLEEVKELLAKGANPNTTNKCKIKQCSPLQVLSNSSLLHLAVLTLQENIVALLIKKGADVNHQNKYRETPLHYAARNGLANITKLLIDGGAQSLPNIFHLAPDQLAERVGHHELAMCMRTNQNWHLVLKQNIKNLTMKRI